MKPPLAAALVALALAPAQAQEPGSAVWETRAAAAAFALEVGRAAQDRVVIDGALAALARLGVRDAAASAGPIAEAQAISAFVARGAPHGPVTPATQPAVAELLRHSLPAGAVATLETGTGKGSVLVVLTAGRFAGPAGPWRGETACAPRTPWSWRCQQGGGPLRFPPAGPAGAVIATIAEPG